MHYCVCSISGTFLGYFHKNDLMALLHGESDKPLEIIELKMFALMG